ncbi:hypothetical protein [Raineya sp.]|jgi:hypothetical protein
MSRDYIKIHKKWLPQDLQNHSDIQWQTKDLEGLLLDYYIDENGFLMEISEFVYDDDWVYQNIVKRYPKRFYKIFYEGIITFSAEDHMLIERHFVALFKKGKLKFIKEVTDSFCREKSIDEEWKKDFNYFPSERLPALILGVSVEDINTYEDIIETKPKKKYPFERFFFNIDSETVKYFYATILPFREEIKYFIKNMCQNHIEQMRHTIVRLSHLISYQKKIKKGLGVDCESSYKDFDKRLLPIDFSIENLEQLTDKKLPESPNEMFSEGYLWGWQIFILT